MSRLGDDELSLILSCIHDRNDRNSFSLVCKQWLRVEGLTRSSLHLLDPESLPSLLPRFPNLLQFQSSTTFTNHNLKLLSQTCPKLYVLNLNFKPRHTDTIPDQLLPSQDVVGDDGLRALASACRALSEVSLRRRTAVGNPGVVALCDSAKHLTHLDLGWCNLISDEALEAIGCLSSITVLNLQGCSLITDRGLAYLASGPSCKLKRLVLAECDRITDRGVCLLQGLWCLEELNMAECGPKVTDTGCVAIAGIPSLRKLKLSWLVNVSDVTVVALAEKGRNLVAVDFTGCELISGGGIRAFARHGNLEGLVMPCCYNICADDVEFAVLGCKSLSYVVLDKGLRMWIPMATQLNITRFCELHWT